MNWIRRLFQRGEKTRRGSRDRGLSRFAEEMDKTQMKMASAFTFALQVRDPELNLVGHCTLVSLIAESIAERIDVSEPDQYILDTATRLHELGMVSVPAELLKRPTPLTTAELERVRLQAAVGAEIVRAMHHPRVAWLIEHQYEDYYSLHYRAEISEKDLLLAGIFRVADVMAAVTSPRPYQDAMPVERQAEMLEKGAGTQFHPLAVRFALDRLSSM